VSRLAVQRPAEESRPFRLSARPSLPLRHWRVGRVRPEPNPRLQPRLVRQMRRIPRRP
jgi:hypothetical protein